jgi:hypothetical protein
MIEAPGVALFFDTTWFAARLAALGLERDDLALAAGISGQELALIWKDQREVSPQEVDCFAAMLGETPETIASRCGVTTRPALPRSQPDDLPGRRLAELEERIAVLEQTVALLLDQATANRR